MTESTGPGEVWQVVEVRLPRMLYDRLCDRVDRLDTTIQDWVSTVIIEALERPDTPPPGIGLP